MANTKIYKGKRYALKTVSKSGLSYCPGCAFDKIPAFCTRFANRETVLEREMSKGCSSVHHPRFTAIWEEQPYPWYAKLANGIKGLLGYGED